MKRVTTLDEWKLVYKRGHLAFVVNYTKIFLRDSLFLAFVLLALIRLGIIKAFSTAVMIGQGVAFILLGVGLGELQWFLYKKAFGGFLTTRSRQFQSL
jgi:hypothetical protein